MSTPFEIIGAPVSLWLAPLATAFPLIDAAPSVSWIKVGTQGDKNYSDAGVTVSHSQAFAQARPAGTTGPTKAWRTSEDLMVSLELWDVSLEQYAQAMNNTTVTTTAAGVGTAGFKKMGMSQGQNVALFALLARGVSPYGDGMAMQYEVPRCYQSESPKPVYVKGKPAGLALQFTALEDLTASTPAERFGRIVAQHAVAL